MGEVSPYPCTGFRGRVFVASTAQPLGYKLHPPKHTQTRTRARAHTHSHTATLRLSVSCSSKVHGMPCSLTHPAGICLHVAAHTRTKGLRVAAHTRTKGSPNRNANTAASPGPTLSCVFTSSFCPCCCPLLPTTRTRSRTRTRTKP